MANDPNPILSIIAEDKQFRRLVGRLTALAKGAQQVMTRIDRSESMKRIRQARAEARARVSQLKEVARRTGAIAGRITDIGGKGLLKLLGGFAATYLSVRAIERTIIAIVRSVREWISSGIELNRLFELMEIGVAATLAQTSKMQTATGRQVEGMEAVIALQGISLRLQKDIVAAAFESGSTLQNFLEAFRIALPLARQMGNSVEDTVDVTKRLVLAATAIGVPFELVRLQIDDILRGLITTRTTLARVLGLTQSELRAAREQGTIVDLVRRKTEAFLQAQKLIAGTFALTLNRARLLSQVIAKDVTEGAFGLLRAVLKSIINQVAVLNKATGELQIRPEFAAIIERAKDAFTELTKAIIGATPLLIRAFGAMAAAMTPLISSVTLLHATWLEIGASVNAMRGEWDKTIQMLDRSHKEFREATSRMFDMAKVYEIFDEFAKVFERSATDAEKELGRKPITIPVRATFEEALATAKQAIAQEREITFTVGFSTDFERVFTQYRRQIDAFIQKIGDAADVRVESFSKKLAQKMFGMSPEDVQSLAALNQRHINSLAQEAKKNIRRAEAALLLLEEKEPDEEQIRRLFGLMGIPFHADPAVARKTILSFKRVFESEAKRVKITPIIAEPSAEAQIAEVRARGAERLLVLREKQAALDTEIARAESGLVGIAEEEREQRVGLLKIQRAELEVQERLQRVLIQRAAVAVSREGEQKNRERVRLAEMEVDLSEALAKVSMEEARIGARILKIEQQRVKAAEDLAEAEKLREVQRPVEEAERKALQARKELLSATKSATEFEKVSVAEAERKLAIAEALADIAKAEAGYRQADIEAQQTLLRLYIAETKFGKESKEASVAAAEATEKERAASEAALRVDEARQELLEQQYKTHLAIVEAIRDQVTASDAIVRSMQVVSDVVSRFSAGLPKLLSNIFATFEAINDLRREIISGVQRGFRSDLKSLQAAKPIMTDIFGNLPVWMEDAEKAIQGQIEGVKDLYGAFKQMFKSWDGFKKSLKTTLAPLLGMISVIAANFAQGAVQGIGATIQAIGAVIPGTAGGIIQAAGVVVQSFADVFTKAARRISKQIARQVNQIIIAFRAGESKLSDTIAALERQRAEAVARLSGKKGGRKELDKLLPEIDQAIADLKKQQKEVFESLEREIRVLRLDEAFQGIGRSIEDLNARIQQFLDAGGSYLKAQEFLALSLQRLYRDLNRELQDEELQTIDLLQREIELHKEREDVIRTAAERERAVRQKLGIARPLTPAQEAALEIREIRRARDEQLDRLDRELDLIRAQLGEKQAIFDLESNINALHARRLELMEAQADVQAEQLRALLDFLAHNRAYIEQLAAAYPIGGVPTLPQFIGGRLVTNEIQIGQVNLQLPEGASPSEMWRRFREAIYWGAENDPEFSIVRRTA